MAGSRGMWVDEPKRLRKEGERSPDQRRGNHRPRQGREPGVVEPMVNTRPAQFRPVPKLNPVLTERIEVREPEPERPALPRTVGVLESWDTKRGFGFVIAPDGERFYLNTAALTFDVALIQPGQTLEFTAVTPKGMTNGKRCARHVAISGASLTTLVETYVVRILAEKKMVLLSNPDATAGGQSIVAFGQAFLNVLEQQDVVAHVLDTPMGRRAVRVDPL